MLEIVFISECEAGDVLLRYVIIMIIYFTFMVFRN